MQEEEKKKQIADSAAIREQEAKRSKVAGRNII
jgi:hypothetical protein